MSQQYSSIISDETNEESRINQLRSFLYTYKLSQYFEIFISEGFDRLLTLFDITESDLISLNVKRGHRRLLQRAIATARGIPLSTPIIINHGFEESISPVSMVIPSQATMNTYNKDTNITYVDIEKESLLIQPAEAEELYQPNNYSYDRRRQKQKYVSPRPMTAFNILVNEIKNKYGDQLVYSEVKLMASNCWSNMTMSEKEQYEREALHTNSDYILESEAIYNSSSSSSCNSEFEEERQRLMIEEELLRT
ncbi:MAG: hypothetical protein EXX96DRAFT_646609 [Benjaminiella poitrasii]|nr:MAG: hypothetical protein EXX96DRAFT_646609 [Benjaminiella poitrasii]